MTDLSLSSRAGVRPIELGRGNTLALEQAAGVTVRLVEGSAWLSGGRSSYRMRAGDAIAINNNGMTLVYSFEHASVCLEGTHACNSCAYVEAVVLLAVAAYFVLGLWAVFT